MSCGRCSTPVRPSSPTAPSPLDKSIRLPRAFRPADRSSRRATGATRRCPRCWSPASPWPRWRSSPDTPTPRPRPASTPTPSTAAAARRRRSWPPSTRWWTTARGRPPGRRSARGHGRPRRSGHRSAGRSHGLTPRHDGCVWGVSSVSVSWAHPGTGLVTGLVTPANGRAVARVDDRPLYLVCGGIPGESRTPDLLVRSRARALPRLPRLPPPPVACQRLPANSRSLPRTPGAIGAPIGAPARPERRGMSRSASAVPADGDLLGQSTATGAATTAATSVRR